jgi:hypothetical protein
MRRTVSRWIDTAAKNLLHGHCPWRSQDHRGSACPVVPPAPWRYQVLVTQ